MRSENEMMHIILGFAKADDRIRAVYMNGSRTNLNVPKDIFQDYDIVYVVTETESFLKDKSWITIFGSPIIIQEPDRNDVQTGIADGKFDFSRRYVWLMLFNDGNRIDLSIEIKEEAEKNFLDDKLTILLLDKDNFLPEIKPPTDEDYHIKKPNKNQYYACCNEFWWCLNNVAKGIARDELPYAMKMFNHYVRDMLNKMIEWYIGINTNFSVSAGKMGKYYKKFLPSEFYELYTKTYCDSNYDNFWEAIFISCDLFRKTALTVASHFDYTYNNQEGINMVEYLNNVKNNKYNFDEC